MRLKDGFITHKSNGEHITVTAGNMTFNGMIRSNETAGFIVECLKESITREQLLEKMLEKYEVSREQLEQDVDKILELLQKIDAIED